MLIYLKQKVNILFFRESSDDLKHKEYYLFFVPTRSLLCEKRLEVSYLFL